MVMFNSFLYVYQKVYLKYMLFHWLNPVIIPLVHWCQRC